VVFVGYGLLVLGMCIVLGTRIAQARTRAGWLEAARVQRTGGAGGKAALGLLLALALGSPARADDPALDTLRRLPVQHDGRAMPLDTLAREAVREVTGERRFRGEDPVATALAWTFDPQVSVAAPLVELGSADLAAAAGLPPGTTHAPFIQLVQTRRILDLMGEARRAADEGRPRGGALAAAEKLERRLRTMDGFLAREAIRPIPIPADPGARWNALQPMLSRDELLALARGARLPGWPTAAEIDREIGYNQLRPTRVAWIVLAAALVLSLLAWARGSKLLDGLALLGLLAGFAAMTWGIGTRWAIAGRIPAANMYESLLFLGWGIGLFAVLAFAALRNRLVVLNANAMAALTMALTDLLPIDGFIHPVAPVLSGTPWLAIHVPIIMVSYAVLALGVIVAHMQIGFTIFAPRRAELVQRMSELLYWYIQVGSLLLVTGILTGSVWAASSWGRYWGWDPKEVWSLVAFLAYVAILHARWERMIGPFGVAAISIAAFQTILMTYLGVNFVLGIGLHSYGMGDSPVLVWMGLVLLAEAAFLAWGWLALRRGGAAAPEAPAV
jgi:cytochrome c-type biogenesis protein CcsB